MEHVKDRRVETDNSKKALPTKPLNLCVGDVVEVRSVNEILTTLDQHGGLEALPFMPEMLHYCGKRFRVYKRADKTCDTINRTGIRRMKGTVHLEGLRCSGEEHGGCQAACLLFWKEAWLKRVSHEQRNENSASTPQRATGNAPTNGASGWETARAMLVKDTQAKPLVEGTSEDDVTYRCQATQLFEATSKLAWWDIRQYFRDVWSGNVSFVELIKGISILSYNFVQHHRQGGKYPYFETGKLAKTPACSLNLQIGQLVQVKSTEEISQTLDKVNKNRGLSFDSEMVRYCGGKYKVLTRVEKIISEKTGKMMQMPNDCIILDGAICVGTLYKFCPRGIYPYWREIWLRRSE
jgi:hypothetical protein